MVICAVFNCRNRSDRDKVSFYRLPVAHPRSTHKELIERRRNAWLSRLNRTFSAEMNMKNIRVCSLHFVNGKPSDLHDETNPDWAPSVNLGYVPNGNTCAAVERYNRSQKRKMQPEDIDMDDNATQTDSTTSVQPDDIDLDDVLVSSDNYATQTDVPLTDSTSVQTDLEMNYIKDLERENNVIKSENERLKKLLQAKEVNEEYFNDDKKVNFYTGVTSLQLLLSIYNFLMKGFETCNRTALTAFQEFVLFLMRLRLNLLTQDLAYRFNISQPTVCRIFDKWLHVTFVRLKDCVIWPQREQLIQSMPLPFKLTFGASIAVIVDCFEIFCDRPTSLNSRASTWSNYKHHNTVKFLIGITPTGVISFISNAWGGRASDKFISENCGLLEHLLPGDVILADRGFNIDDSVGLYCAKLITPAHMKGKKQMSAVDIHESRKISSLRIHVERAIGNVKNKFRILKGPLWIEVLTKKHDDNYTAIDKIVNVCCAITNLCPAIVL